MRLTRWLLLRLFGLTAVVAVGAFWLQLPGLVGSRGIAPAAETMASLRAAEGVGFFDVPTLLWLSSSDAMLHLLAALGVLAGVALVAGLAPRVALGVLWASWLSLVTAGAPFLSFQWDVLLLEASFFLFFYAPPGLRPRLSTEPEPTRVARFLLAWLACRLTLASGIVKLAGGDPAWRDLTALTWHFWTQPLPAWSSWLYAGLPLVVQKGLCAATLLLELPLPLLALGPRRLRLVAGAGLIALQVGLMSAGNYSFYNLLTAALAVPLLDDAALRRLVPRRFTLPALPPAEARPARRWELALAALVVALGVGAFLRRTLERAPIAGVLRAIAPFETINSYGAFARMTKSRPEIVLEGSADGVTWTPYEFKWKPGRLDRRPAFVAPYQPRLDWQMWFAALGTCSDQPWLLSFQRHLLSGTPEVVGLLESSPFPAAPPRYVRALLYEYRFSSEKGQWWTRTLTGEYCPPLALAEDGRLRRAEELTGR